MATVEQTQPAAARAEHRLWPFSRHDLRMALIITRREVRDAFRDWRIIIPIVLLTLFFPLLMNFTAGRMLRFVSDYGAELVGTRLIPFLLLVVGFFPTSFSLVIALETFVGEKERRSLEPLLASPLTNAQLYLGKVLAAVVPPLFASYLGIAVYLVGLAITVDWTPPWQLFVQTLLLTTIQGIVMVAGAVIVSSQTTSTRAANLLASFIIVPMSLLIILESIIMFGAPDAESPRGIFALWVILGGLVIATGLFMRIGTRIFNREDLLASSLDVLNLRWIGRTFWRGLRGEPGGGLLTWYREAVLPAARQLRKPALAVLLALALSLLGGWVIGTWTDFRIPAGAVKSQAEVSANLSSLFELGAHPGTVLLAVWQNSRVLLAATLLAAVSFGVMAVVLALVPFGILGWAFAQFGALGMPPALFLAAVIPHSLVEIPAIFLATAAALRMGAVITERPPAGKTVGEMLLLAMADVVKIGIGLVLPLLVVAALVEVYITPAMVQLALGG